MKLDSQRARTPADLLAFAHGAEAHDFEPASRAEAYSHIRDALRRFPYERLSRAERGMLRAYLRKSAGFSRAQLPRLIAQCRGTGRPRDRRRATATRTQRPARASASRRRAPGRPPRPVRRVRAAWPRCHPLRSRKVERPAPPFPPFPAECPKKRGRPAGRPRFSATAEISCFRPPSSGPWLRRTRRRDRRECHPWPLRPSCRGRGRWR